MIKTFSLKRLYIISLLIFLLALLFAFFYTKPVPTKGIAHQKVIIDFSFIFLNNLKVSLLLILLGPLTLGLGTLIVLVINGLILGSALGSIKDNLSLVSLLAPHGIIEIPILLLAASIGFKMVINVFSMKIDFKFVFKYLLIVIGGLLIAASIETFVTPMFLKGAL
ncbi:stage II sporulation protein M [Bacillus sp. MUM 13]|uniref:stage II sporulation protein M n=1 Tax=Bacillus sp. MUM 13 TaxID=1678001 RepID=UPI001113510E|nr:stage II sporulation protein M [Bacillus sp. MUM 13]